MKAPVFASPDEAEEAFYSAFENKDLRTLMSVWDDAEDTLCIHPGREAMLGALAIRASFLEMLRLGPEMRFRTVLKAEYRTETLSVRVVVEYIRTGGRAEEAMVSATNVFRLAPNGWRLVSHHAGPTAEDAGDDDSPTVH